MKSFDPLQMLTTVCVCVCVSFTFRSTFTLL